MYICSLAWHLVLILMMEAVMDRITIDTSIYEFTKEIKVRPTDKTINAHCVYGLTTEYTFNKETDDFDEERHVLIEELFVPFVKPKPDTPACSFIL